MPSSSVPEKVECKTIDGTMIRGLLYVAVASPAPAIIMTPGEMLLPEVAQTFQSMGYTALIYDPRSIGDSDGMPRNQIDPLKQAEDLTDIVTFVEALPTVDSSRIALWGMSFGSTVSACATAMDRRVKAIVMVCPILSFYQSGKRDKVFPQLIKDRKSQLSGNEPFALAPFNAKGENPIGMAGSGGPGGLEAYGFMSAVMARGAPGFRNKITLQTYYKLAMWYPKECLAMMDATPVMMITPELDGMSPPQEQREVFDKFRQPKRFYLAKGKGHLTVLSGEGSEQILTAQEDFIKAAFAGSLV